MQPPGFFFFFSLTAQINNFFPSYPSLTLANTTPTFGIFLPSRSLSSLSTNTSFTPYQLWGPGPYLTSLQLPFIPGNWEVTATASGVLSK